MRSLAASVALLAALACGRLLHRRSSLRCYRTFYGSDGWKTFYETCNYMQQCVQQISVGDQQIFRPMDSERIMYGCGNCSDIAVYQMDKKTVSNLACQYIPSRQLYKCCCNKALCNTPQGISGAVIPMIAKYQQYGIQGMPCTNEDYSYDVELPMRNFAAINNLAWKRFEQLNNESSAVCESGMYCCKMRFKSKYTSEILGSLQKCIPAGFMHFLTSSQLHDVICASPQLIDNVRAGVYDMIPNEADLVLGVYSPQNVRRPIRKRGILMLKRLEIRVRALVVGVSLFFGFSVVAIAIIFRTFAHENEECRVARNVGRYIIRFNSYPPEIQALMRMRSAERLAKIQQQQREQRQQQNQLQNQQQILAALPTTATTATSLSTLA